MIVVVGVVGISIVDMLELSASAKYQTKERLILKIRLAQGSNLSFLDLSQSGIFHFILFCFVLFFGGKGAKISILSY